MVWIKDLSSWIVLNAIFNFMIPYDIKYKLCKVQTGRQAGHCNHVQLCQRGFEGGGLCQRDQRGDNND